MVSKVPTFCDVVYFLILCFLVLANSQLASNNALHVVFFFTIMGPHSVKCIFLTNYSGGGARDII